MSNYFMQIKETKEQLTDGRLKVVRTIRKPNLSLVDIVTYEKPSAMSEIHWNKGERK